MSWKSKLTESEDWAGPPDFYMRPRFARRTALLADAHHVRITDYIARALEYFLEIPPLERAHHLGMPVHISIRLPSKLLEALPEADRSPTFGDVVTGALRCFNALDASERDAWMKAHNILTAMMLDGSNNDQ